MRSETYDIFCANSTAQVIEEAIIGITDAWLASTSSVAVGQFDELTPIAVTPTTASQIEALGTATTPSTAFALGAAPAAGLHLKVTAYPAAGNNPGY